MHDADHAARVDAALETQGLQVRADGADVAALQAQQVLPAAAVLCQQHGEAVKQRNMKGF